MKTMRQLTHGFFVAQMLHFVIRILYIAKCEK